MIQVCVRWSHGGISGTLVDRSQFNKMIHKFPSAAFVAGKQIRPFAEWPVSLVADITAKKNTRYFALTNLRRYCGYCASYLVLLQ